MSEIKVDRVECRELVVKHPDHDTKFTVVGLPQGVGLWLGDNAEGKPTVAIYVLDGLPCVGLYGKGDKNHGVTVCLSTDQDGEPQIQFVKRDGTVLFLTAADVEKMQK